MRKTVTRRALALLLCLCTLIPCVLLGGCTPSEQPDTPDDPSAPAEGTPVAFIKDGATEYSVVRSDFASNDVSTAAVELRKALTAATGAIVGIASDWVDRGTAVPEGTPEILVGLTNRKESIEAHAALKETEYSIAVVGNRLVIVGYDDICTIAAVNVFITELLGYDKKAGTYTASELVLAGNFKKEGTHIVKSPVNEHDKTSLSMYLDDKLKASEEELFAFDDPEAVNRFAYLAEDRDGYDDCVGFTQDANTTHWDVFNLPTGTFSAPIDDKFTQTIKLWVYINDIDLLVCDHDAVYDTPQVGSGTLYITLSDKKGAIGHTWQHTLAGSGWHEIELSFTCHNVAYPNLEKINYENLTQMSIWCNAKAGLELRFDDMRLCTYKNPGYTQPEAPYGGRWLSTCDYEALDGPILTEWYGNYFDFEDMTQGSSSVAIIGHKENVDHRVCIGVKDVPINYEEDTVCFDMYISDLSLLGTDWQVRLEHNAQAAHYSLNYQLISSHAVNDKMQKTALKKGWNHFQIPVKEMRVAIGEGYENTFTNNLVMTQLVFYIAGTGASEAQNYLIRYDNIYVTKTANLEAAKAELAK